MGARYCERCNVRCLTTLCGQCEQQDQIDKASSEAVATALAADRARIARLIQEQFDGHDRAIVRLDDLLRVVEGAPAPREG